MKPTIQQVVAHFGLPDEAVGSEHLKVAIMCLPFISDDPNLLMGTVDISFERLFGCQIQDWFKPNYGKDE